jgi:hypothetical protein
MKRRSSQMNLYTQTTIPSNISINDYNKFGIYVTQTIPRK